MGRGAGKGKCGGVSPRRVVTRARQGRDCGGGGVCHPLPIPPHCFCLPFSTSMWHILSSIDCMYLYAGEGRGPH